MINKITVTVNGKRELAVAGLTISEIIKGEKPCGGHGKCGKCKVIARGALSEPTAVELDLLSQNERDAGVRLACLTVALGDCEIETLDKKEKSQIVTGAELPEFELYMDQVIGLVEKYLRPLYPENKTPITPSMINNYVKNGALPPPQNKKPP